MIIVVEEEQSLRCQSGQVVCPAIGEITRGCGIVQIKPLAEFLLQPLLSGAQAPLLLDSEENLVQAEQLIFALRLLSHEAADVLVVCIRIRINGRIGQGVLINKIVNELAEVELTGVDSIDIFKILTVLFL